MAKEKPGVMMYWSTFDVLESLLDGQAKTMLRAIRYYSQYGEVPDFGEDTILATLWLLIRPLMDADNERYERIREKRRQAINTRWQREREERTDEYGSIQEYTNEYKTYGSIQNIPITNPVSIPDTVTDPQPESFTDAEPNAIPDPNPESFTNADSESSYEGKRDSYNESYEGRRDCAGAPSTPTYRELLSVDSVDPVQEQEAERLKQAAIAKLQGCQEERHGI